MYYQSQGTLTDYVSHVQSPMIPSLVVHCVNEIEQRGLHEVSCHLQSVKKKSRQPHTWLKNCCVFFFLKLSLYSSNIASNSFSHFIYDWAQFHRALFSPRPASIGCPVQTARSRNWRRSSCVGRLSRCSARWMISTVSLGSSRTSSGTSKSPSSPSVSTAPSWRLQVGVGPIAIKQ